MSVVIAIVDAVAAKLINVRAVPIGYATDDAAGIVNVLALSSLAG